MRPSHPSPILGLGADRKDVRNNQGPLSEALTMRPSHPSPILGEGPGVRANKRIPTPQTSNSSTCSVRP
jgi:hypothetical protein